MKTLNENYGVNFDEKSQKFVGILNTPVKISATTPAGLSPSNPVYRRNFIEPVLALCTKVGGKYYAETTEQLNAAYAHRGCIIHW